MADIREWAKAYRTPVALVGVFIALMVVFAVTPDPHTTSSIAPTSTSAASTPGPHECIVCSIDKVCDPSTSQCVYADHTPMPCVKAAKYDDQAGFCLPTGAPQAPAVSSDTSGSDFPPGIRRNRKPRQPRNDTSGASDPLSVP
jgi:hypothetical protein